ncbi:hypothetical protein HYT23_04900 [Candidatus Pacearchaeota archaeon]|nr:hypothetical protein [Candidatus Pacearchaeota archaeon]
MVANRKVSDRTSNYFYNEWSELNELLGRNAYGDKELTEEEINRAWDLIAHPRFFGENGEKCWVCKEHTAIYDTGLCQGHANYALCTRK